jgi:Amt family ammonium transporter
MDSRSERLKLGGRDDSHQVGTNWLRDVGNVPQPDRCSCGGNSPTDSRRNAHRVGIRPTRPNRADVTLNGWESVQLARPLPPEYALPASRWSSDHSLVQYAQQFRCGGRNQGLAITGHRSIGCSHNPATEENQMPEINAGDTAWMLVATALVMLMTPGLAFFYGGLVRRKNVLSTIMHSLFILALVSVTWVLWGYSLAFGPDTGLGIIGGLDWVGLEGVTADPSPIYAPTVPHYAFMAFQMMFAIITPALITGAFAERKRFKAFVLFSVAWATLVYAPIAHWVWSPNGWLYSLGVLDFAGGTVVHLSSGIAALVAALMVGRRIGVIRETEPHDVTMTVLGAGLLWFGWFGFNAGSALAANGVAALALVTTNTAAAMAALTWVTISWLHKGTPSVLGAALGAVAGLVAITPAAGYVSPAAAILIGGGVAVVCYGAAQLRIRSRVDDALDVFAVHGVGGAFGALATGVFASVAVNAAGRDGALAGNLAQVAVQALAVVAVAAYSALATAVILLVINAVVRIRVPSEAEEAGLDMAQHGEIAYQL